MIRSQHRPAPPVRRSALAAWCTFDWANSAFPTVIMTYVFAAYFAKAVAADDVQGTSQWAYAISLSGVAIAVASPLLGAIADASGRRKPWVAAFSAVCVSATALLWLVTPDTRWVPFALVLAALGNFAFEMSTVFYNAMLPKIAPRGMIGRLSGWGWGLGYFGGLTCLLLALLLLVRPEPPLFGLDTATAEPVRASALLVALWFALFSLPFFLLVPDAGCGQGVGAGAAMRRGLCSLVETIGQVRRYRQAALFLLAHMLYADGLNTLFTIGGIYVAVTFRMDFDEILIFGIAMNVFAGIGAFAFGWVDDRLGPRRTIIIALLGLSAIGLGLIVADSTLWLWLLAMPLGIFLGPAQSASRSLMARLAPPALTAEFFGLYALSGKATAFVGPALYGLVTDSTGSPRLGLTTIIVFLLAGLALLLPVREPPAPTSA